MQAPSIREEFVIMTSVRFLGALLATVLVASANAQPITGLDDIEIANSMPGAMNPLCPTKLNSDSDRYKCYSKTIRKIFDYIEQADYSNPIRMKASAEIFAPLMEPDCMGRSSGGQFNNASANAAYLSAAFPSMLEVGNWAEPPQMDLFTSSGFVAAFGANYMRYSADGSRGNWTLWGTARFHPDTNRMTHYDVDFRRYKELLYTLKTLSNDAAFNAARQNWVAHRICTITFQKCLGPYSQWESLSQCVETLSEKKIVSMNGAILDDTLQCRLIFSSMVQFNHGYHCPNIGPSGGSACINIPYQTYYSFFPENIFVSKPHLMS